MLRVDLCVLAPLRLCVLLLHSIYLQSDPSGSRRKSATNSAEEAKSGLSAPLADFRQLPFSLRPRKIMTSWEPKLRVLWHSNQGPSPARVVGWVECLFAIGR